MRTNAFACLLTSVAISSVSAQASRSPGTDTLRVAVGSPLVNGKVYAPHAARVRVRVGADSAVSSEWTNELTLGDSAGRPVQRWVTRGRQAAPNGSVTEWVLRQTYDAVTLAPYGYDRSSSNGAFMRLRLDGRYIRGTARSPGDTTIRVVNDTLDQPGFFAGASDLVPLAVGLKRGTVMTAPMWSPAMKRAEPRVFTVLDEVTIPVEGTPVKAWKVEERRQADRALLATWYLIDRSPYMVYGEVPLPNGQIRRMSEVAIPTP